MSQPQREQWTTSITNIQRDSIEIRGYNIVELIGNISFSDQIYLIITGELPDPQVSKVFEAILCAAIDHGAGTPSALAARTAISGGASINGAVATGLLTMGNHHGAAVEACMQMLHRLADNADKEHTLKEAIETLVSEFQRNGKLVPGLGHRVHPVDPRAKRLEEIAETCGFQGKYLACIRQVSSYLSKKKGKAIPVNIDGVTAALLCEIGFPGEFGNIVFMISRIVGIFTQAMEEKLTQKPMRHIDPICIEYTGQPARKLKVRGAQT